MKKITLKRIQNYCTFTLYLEDISESNIKKSRYASDILNYYGWSKVDPLDVTNISVCKGMESNRLYMRFNGDVAVFDHWTGDYPYDGVQITIKYQSTASAYAERQACTNADRQNTQH